MRMGRGKVMRDSNAREHVRCRRILCSVRVRGQSSYLDSIVFVGGFYISRDCICQGFVYVMGLYTSRDCIFQGIVKRNTIMRNGPTRACLCN